MASLGREEDGVLMDNVTDQLQRLTTQLKDLDEFRSELDDEEYTYLKAETERQLKLFEANMSTLSGGITLVTSLGKDRLKTLNAIRAAFKTPEVMKMFAQKQPKALRLRLDQLRMDQKLGRVDEDRFKDESVEIIMALKQLGEKLTPAEKKVLDASSELMSKFETADESIGASVMSLAQTSMKGSS